MAQKKKAKKPRVEPYEKLSINISERHHEMFVKEAGMRKWSFRIMMEQILDERYFSDENE